MEQPNDSKTIFSMIALVAIVAVVGIISLFAVSRESAIASAPVSSSSGELLGVADSENNIGQAVSLNNSAFIWTAWNDIDDPSSSGDYEQPSNARYKCANPVAIECKATKEYFNTGSYIDWSQTGEKVYCSLENGVVCVNSNQPDGKCDYDYAMRYGCPYYSYEWTAWLDRDNPDGSGDYEERLYVPSVCDNPLAVECRTTSGKDYSETGEKVTCNKNGFTCVNSNQPDGVCNYDYKVRFACEAPEYVVYLNSSKFPGYDTYMGSLEKIYFDSNYNANINELSMLETGEIVSYVDFAREYVVNGKTVTLEWTLLSYDGSLLRYELLIETPYGSKTLIKEVNASSIPTISDRCATYAGFPSSYYLQQGFDSVQNGVAVDLCGVRYFEYDGIYHLRYAFAIPNDSPLWMNTSFNRTFTDVRDLAGNGVLHYTYWGTDYRYADGFCRLVKDCEGYVSATTIDDHVKACRCDEYWGCPLPKNSCVTDVAANSLWTRFGTVTCYGCA